MLLVILDEQGGWALEGVSDCFVEMCFGCGVRVSALELGAFLGGRTPSWRCGVLVGRVSGPGRLVDLRELSELGRLAGLSTPVGFRMLVVLRAHAFL
jgi:hypothetical protein